LTLPARGEREAVKALLALINSPNAEALRNFMSITLRKILRECGVLLIPAGVVSLFCQLIGVGPQKTAAYSIETILLIVCCLNRKWINTKVPSALVLSLFFGLAGIFYINYQTILFKDTGLIKRYKHSADFQGDIGHEIERADQEIWFFAANFHISTFDRRQALLDRLQHGVHIRYLILDPFALNIDRIAEDFGSSPDTLKKECMDGIHNLIELKCQWDSLSKSCVHSGELEIKFFKTTPRARLYVFDPRKTSGHTLFVPYINNMNSQFLPAYLLENIQSGVFPAYFEGVQKIWTDSTNTFDKFLADHPDIK
jgi:hypothetical protein